MAVLNPLDITQRVYDDTLQANRVTVVTGAGSTVDGHFLNHGQTYMPSGSVTQIIAANGQRSQLQIFWSGLSANHCMIGSGTNLADTTGYPLNHGDWMTIPTRDAVYGRPKANGSMFYVEV